jgi:hypothetical protein
VTASSSFRFSDKSEGISRRFVAPGFRKFHNLKPLNLRRSVGTEDFAPKDFWLTNDIDDDDIHNSKMVQLSEETKVYNTALHFTSKRSGY